MSEKHRIMFLSVKQAVEAKQLDLDTANDLILKQARESNRKLLENVKAVNSSNTKLLLKLVHQSYLEENKKFNLSPTINLALVEEWL